MGKIILEKEVISRTLRRISHEVIENNKDLNDLVIVGIKTRGAIMAKRLVDNIKAIEGIDVPFGELDITFYRDDIENRVEGPRLKGIDIDFAVEDKVVIIVDDVLFTGRTIRAAMDAIMDLGRASKIRLAVLVDRGHRELPIRADYVGKNIPTSLNESVKVKFEETDNNEYVEIL
jgi:pyrimidine operon attenuation protein/uracil phosphoribosyltransferase